MAVLLKVVWLLDEDTVIPYTIQYHSIISKCIRLLHLSLSGINIKALYPVEDVLLPCFGSSCLLGGKGHCKSLQVILAGEMYPVLKH